MRALLFVLVTLIPKTATMPELHYLNSGQHQAINPLRIAITMKVDCGVEYEKAIVQLKAGETLDVWFKTPDGRGNEVCLMDSYVRKP